MASSGSLPVTHTLALATSRMVGCSSSIQRPGKRRQFGAVSTSSRPSVQIIHVLEGSSLVRFAQIAASDPLKTRVGVITV